MFVWITHEDVYLIALHYVVMKLKLWHKRLGLMHLDKLYGGCFWKDFSPLMLEWEPKLFNPDA